MKKRIFPALLALALLCALSAQTVMAAEMRRAPSPILDLSFDGTTAVCYANCRGDRATDRVSATMTLYQGSRELDSWSGSGTWQVSLSGEHRVVSGQTYRLEVTYSINGVEQTPRSTTRTCP